MVLPGSVWRGGGGAPMPGAGAGACAGAWQGSPVTYGERGCIFGRALGDTSCLLFSLFLSSLFFLLIKKNAGDAISGLGGGGH